MASKPPGRLNMKFLQNFDQSLNPKNESPSVISSKKSAFSKDKKPMFVNDRGSLIPPTSKCGQGSESAQVGKLQQNHLHKTTQPEIPKTTRPEFLKRTGPEIPKVTRPEFPKTTRPEIPKTTRPELPKTIRPQFPKKVQAEFPNAIKPEIANKTQPDITKDKHRPTANALTNKIPSAFSNELASKLGSPKKVQEQKTPGTSSKGWTVPSAQTAPSVPPSSIHTGDPQHDTVERTDSIPIDQAPPPPQEHGELPVLFYKGRRLPSKVKINGISYKLTPLPLNTGEPTPSRPLRTPEVVPIVPDDADADEMYVKSSSKYSIAPDSSDEDEEFGYQDTVQEIQRAGYITDETYDDCIVDPQYQHEQYPVEDENYDDCNVDEAVYEEL